MSAVGEFKWPSGSTRSTSGIDPASSDSMAVSALLSVDRWKPCPV
ncbi:hypothetical protein [Alkalicoccus daliensis]|nr:hypothetical protein [Alkalicoccus daliensis]